MARPKKFRISLEEVTHPDNARRVAGHVAEIEFFRKQIKDLQENIADVYDAAEEDGFDKKFIRLAVARRAKDPDAAKAVEAGVDTYEEAIDLGFSSRARVENLEHDADGVIIEQGPADRSAAGVALPADTQSTAAERRSAETDATLVVMPHADGSIGSERHGESVPVDTNNPGGENANSVGNADASHSPDDAAVEKRPSREPHKLEIAGSSPAPATISETPGPGAPAALEGAHNPTSGAVPANNVTTFTRKPHDGPVSSKGLARHKLCQHVDLCAGTWREACFDCRKAAADAQGLTA